MMTLQFQHLWISISVQTVVDLFRFINTLWSYVQTHSSNSITKDLHVNVRTLHHHHKCLMSEETSCGAWNMNMCMTGSPEIVSYDHNYGSLRPNDDRHHGLYLE